MDYVKLLYMFYDINIDFLKNIKQGLSTNIELILNHYIDITFEHLEDDDGRIIIFSKDRNTEIELTYLNNLDKDMKNGYVNLYIKNTTILCHIFNYGTERFIKDLKLHVSENSEDLYQSTNIENIYNITMISSLNRNIPRLMITFYIKFQDKK